MWKIDHTAPQGPDADGNFNNFLAPDRIQKHTPAKAEGEPMDSFRLSHRKFVNREPPDDWNDRVNAQRKKSFDSVSEDLNMESSVTSHLESASPDEMRRLEVQNPSDADGLEEVTYSGVLGDDAKDDLDEKSDMVDDFLTPTKSDDQQRAAVQITEEAVEAATDTRSRNDDAASSVGSVIDDEEIFSQFGSVSSKSSAEPVHLSGIETVAWLLIDDAELLPLYKEAMTKMEGERFVRNQRRLLKMYYKNLRLQARAALELEVTKILRSRRSRISIAQKILRSLISPQDYETARSQKISREDVLGRYFRQVTNRTTNAGEDINKRPATPPGEHILSSGNKGEGSEGSESSENSESDDDEADKAAYPVEYAKKFLVGGSPFELYKQSVRYFVHLSLSSGVSDPWPSDLRAGAIIPHGFQVF